MENLIKESTEIYFYYDGQEPKSFSLTPKQGEKWVSFCRALALQHPEDPRPYFEDYLKFREQLKRENQEQA